MAERFSKKAVKSEPENHRYLDTLAEVYYVRGKKEKAIETIKKALEIDTDNRLYKQQLWRFKHVKATPKKAEAPATSKTAEDSVSENTAEDTSETSEETVPEEENSETAEPSPALEEL